RSHGGFAGAAKPGRQPQQAGTSHRAAAAAKAARSSAHAPTRHVAPTAVAVLAAAKPAVRSSQSLFDRNAMTPGRPQAEDGKLRIGIVAAPAAQHHLHSADGWDPFLFQAPEDLF